MECGQGHGHDDKCLKPEWVEEGGWSCFGSSRKNRTSIGDQAGRERGDRTWKVQ